MEAGGQVWLVLALFSLVGVDRCRAFAKPQGVYNRNGIPGLDGSWSWTTPGGSSVWIQYPVDHRGVIPWTPAGFSYSISSDPASNGIPFNEQMHSNFINANHASNLPNTFRSGRELEIQIPNNNYESSFSHVRNPNANRNDIKIDETNVPHFHNLVPIEFNLSDHEKDNVHSQVINNFQNTVNDKFPGLKSQTLPVTESTTFSVPLLNKFSSSLEDPTESPVDVNTDQFITEASLPVIPPIFDSRNNVENKINGFSRGHKDEHMFIKPKFVPVVRLSSRGRPQRVKPTTRKPPRARKINISPVPRLLQDTPQRERSIRLTSRGRPQLVG